MNTKQCSDCKEIKDVSMFHKRSDSPDGFRGQCKECVNKKKRKWAQNNKSRVKEYRKTWEANNPEKLKIQREKGKKSTKIWRQNNREHISEYNKRHYAANKDYYAEKIKDELKKIKLE